MAQFCTVADLAAFLKITIAADDASALSAILGASAAIQNHCRQTLEAVAGDVVTLDSVGADRILLPEIPVTAVSKVVENGVELATTAYKWTRSGILYRSTGRWTSGIQVIVVTYSHGYAAIPDIVADVCRRAAARAYQAGLRSSTTAGVTGITGEQYPDYQVSFATERGTDKEWMLGASAAPILLYSEQTALERYKVRRLT